MLMIRPLPWRLKAGMAAFAQRKMLVRLRSTTLSHSSSGVSSTESCFQNPPAQLSRMSSRPASATMRSNAVFTRAPSVTSHRTNVAPATLAPASSMSSTYTRAPAAANASADPLPMPLAPPVTATTCPEKSNVVFPMLGLLELPRHRLRAQLAAHPAWHHGREASRGAAGNEDDNLLRRGKLRDPLVGRAIAEEILEATGLGAVGPGREITGGATDRLVEVLPHVPLRPLLFAERSRVLRPDHDQRVAVERIALVVPGARRRPAERGDELRSRAAQMIVDHEGAFAREKRHGAVRRSESPLDVQRLPG